jgi:nucleotide-binding universal stress UspA family protein
MLTIKTILHPTDFSQGSDYAFRLACALGRDYGARLVVLHVVTPPVSVFGGMHAPPPLPEEYDRKEAENKLHQLHPTDASVPVEYRLREGDPAREIVALASEIPCDLIVLGTHGRTGLKRLLMGSVAERVLRLAACPVVTVKHPQGVTHPAGEPHTKAAAR